MDQRKQIKTLVCIGDIHGHLDKLESLWENLKKKMGEALEDATVVFLGDYCDKGPNTKGVIEWLINLKISRKEGTTICLSGNHDFGMASYLDCMPAETVYVDMDVTKDPRFTKGYFKHNVGEYGMHYMGRRWGGSHRYQAKATFMSYGVDMRYSLSCREELMAKVPDHHKDFLNELDWVYDVNLLGNGRGGESSDRVICVHAGLTEDNVEKQLVALAERDTTSKYVVYDRMLLFMQGRNGILEKPEELDALLISGHHGRRIIGRDRIILDIGAGKKNQPIEAIILPERILVSSDS
jgi:hypothetical protein